MANLSLPFRSKTKAAIQQYSGPIFKDVASNLYFDDVVERPGAATPADIEALFSFGVEWLAEVRKHPSSTVVHCGARISRSAASALLLLVLYFENYIAAA